MGLHPSKQLSTHHSRYVMIWDVQPIILFRNSSYFNLLFPYYHPIILTNLVESMHKIASIWEVSM